MDCLLMAAAPGQSHAYLEEINQCLYVPSSSQSFWA
jgi:hypothetical protein